MNAEHIKESVREKYGRIASSQSSCCGPSCGCESDNAELSSITMNELYERADRDVVASADMGLGCGTPTAFADMKEGMTVLDLGAGAGIDVFLAAKAVGPSGRALGLDMTDEMLERAHANKAKLGIGNAQFLKGEIEDMPIESESVDRIISNCVINLVPDKAKAFAEIYRVLRPGGKFTISDVVSVGTIPDETRKDLELWAGCVAGALDKDEYIGIIREAGFTNITIEEERPHKLDGAIPFGLLSITVAGTK